MKRNTLNGTAIFKFCAVLFFAVMVSCKKESTYINLPLSGPNQDFYVLADDNQLVKYNAQNIKNAASKLAITGLVSNTEKLLTIDFRPATGDLYGISNANKLYTINVATAKATVVVDAAFSTAISGTVISMDFNPVTDQIRVVSNTGQNLRINPETATIIATDTNVSGGAIMGIAHTNSIAGATSTDLYDIDPTAKVLYKQDPNNGTLTKIANLGLDVGDNVCLDISPDNKNMLMIGKVGGSLNLYSIELSRNLTKLAGVFKDISTVKGIAIASNPVAYAIGLDANNVSSLLIFNPGSKTAAVSKAITGLQSGEKILGIDMRPANGQVYALGSSNRLYTINLGNGALTQVGSGTFSTALSGTSFGFDFSAQEDKIRVISNTRQNLVISPINAAVTPLADMASGTAINAIAFSNITGTGISPRLYAIDPAAKKLFTVDQNSGILTAVGDLKVAIDENNGFDIGVSNIGDAAYGIFTVEGKTKLYQVNLSSGAATTSDSLIEFTQAITGFTLGRRL